MMFFLKFKIFLLRIFGYEYPLRVAILKFLSLTFKNFRPHYETMLYESCLEAKKLGYDEVSILELGVAAGNGIVSLEKYKKKYQKILDIKINIFGFDTGEGLPESNDKRDLLFFYAKGQYKIDKDELSKVTESKIYYGDINDTIHEFIKSNPKNIICIIFDMDYYSSTKNFLNQMSKLENNLTPRVTCYFDDVFPDKHYVNEHNGVLLAIKEFNNESSDIKIGKSLDSINDFRFPLGRDKIFLLHNFNHKDYNKYVGLDGGFNLSLKTKKSGLKFF